MFLLIFSLLINSILSYTFEIDILNPKIIEWRNDPNIVYSFDVNEYCLSKCLLGSITIQQSDLISDYNVYLQDAVDQLYINGGGTLYIENGLYELSSQLLLYSNVCLVGQSKDETILQLMDYAEPYKYSGFIRSYEEENVTISDITLNGNKDNQYNDSLSEYGKYGIYTELNNHLFMNRVKVEKFISYGFDPHGNKTNWAHNLIITDCESNDNGKDGFTLDQTLNITFTYNNGTNNNRHGLNIVTGSKYGYISNNILDNNGIDSLVGCGIAIQDNDNYGTELILIEKNNVIDNYLNGICLRHVKYINITENEIINSRTNNYCIWVENSQYIIAQNNYCKSTNLINDKNNSLTLFTNNNFSNIIGNTDVPDPYCNLGIKDGLACCYSGCTVCGGINCSKDQYGSSLCCSSTILLSTNYCNEVSAPCIISVNNILSGNPTGSPTTSPVVTPTSSPIVTPSSSPIVTSTSNPTNSPTNGPTNSPIVTSTSNPIVTSTSNPIVTSTTSPILTPTISPIIVTSTSTTSPILTPTISPIVSSTTSPIVTPTISPIVSSTTSPIVTPTISPIVTSTTSPIVTSTTNPIVTSTISPVVSPTISTTSPIVTSTTSPIVSPTISTSSPIVSPTISTSSPIETPTTSPIDNPVSSDASIIIYSIQFILPFLLIVPYLIDYIV
jgi:hypothetical protein